MKKSKFIFLCIALVAFLMFAGCSSRDNGGDATGTEMPNNNSVMDDMATEAGEMADDIMKGASSLMDGATNMMNGTSDSDIGEEKAKEIALNHASVKKDNVAFTKVEKGFEDGKMVYDVKFRAGNTEYEYEIDAMSGEIRESESDSVK